MNSNPEVTTATAPQPAPQPPFALDSSRIAGRDRDERTLRAAAPRVSEDPMRRTDRYRLVVPWSDRV